MVFVGQWALPWLAQLRPDDWSPARDGAPCTAGGPRPALQTLFIAGSLQRAGIGHYVQRVQGRERPAGAADDGAHIVFLGAGGGCPGVILEWGALGRECRAVFGRSGQMPLFLNSCSGRGISDPLGKWTETSTTRTRCPGHGVWLHIQSYPLVQGFHSEANFRSPSGGPTILQRYGIP